MVSSAYMQADDDEGLAPWDQWDQNDEGKYITCEFDSEGDLSVSISSLGEAMK